MSTMCEVISTVTELMHILECDGTASESIRGIKKDAEKELITTIKNLDDCNISYLLFRLKEEWLRERAEYIKTWG